MKKMILLSVAVLTGAMAWASQPQWVSSTNDLPWQERNSPAQAAKKEKKPDIVVNPSVLRQEIKGFGTAFSELSWLSLGRLGDEKRAEIIHELYAPGVGCNFTVNRLPLGNSDFSTHYHSYNDVPGDFEMKNFTLGCDRYAMLPMVKAAKAEQPDMKIWASPWSPPAWLKRNSHYACTPAAGYDGAPPEARFVSNGLAPGGAICEGSDGLVMDDDYLKAYALYFGKFIDAYQAEGIDIFMVAPQNEPNSPQIYSSCCWTAAGLARFIGKYLGPEMDKRGVEIMCGTIERPNELLCDTILTDPDCVRYVHTAGFQWGGKGALPGIAKRYPDHTIVATEHECGNGNNDWQGMEYSWNLIKDYINSGANIYTYWNTSLVDGETSPWGWRQNSLVSVAKDGSWFRYNPEFYLMKHFSHFIQPGARLIETSGLYDGAIAFRNPDGTVILLAANLDDEPRQVSVRLGDNTYMPMLDSHSINTFVFD